MSGNRPIPKSGPGPSSLGRDLVSSFAGSLLSTSPIAQESIARDLADCFDDGEPVDTGAIEEDSVSDSDGGPHPGPFMYRRPSGIAFGTTRPAVGQGGPTPFQEPVLTRIEKKQSRQAERSLLRDNHILPPKHPLPAQVSPFRRFYKKLFTTKVPPEEAPEEAPEQHAAPAETSPLLGEDRRNGEDPAAAGGGNLRQQWEAAVASGQIKTTWRREAMTIAVYSRSLIVTFLLQYSISITSIFAVGHIGKLELGAVSLASMSASIICYAPIQGLATSLDTLCAQAYGSGHKHLVGLQVQRMVVFLLLAVIPVFVLFLNAEPILALIIPERQSAVLAARYLHISIFGVPAYICFEAGKRFVQAQGLFQACTYVLCVAAPINIVLNYTLVWHLGLGFVGAPLAVVITQNMLPLLLFLYVWKVDGSQCWGGFSKRALANWWPMIRLSLPGMLMVEAEWFAFEILTLASGRFGTTALAAQSILVTVTNTTFQIVFPFSIAGSTRVANLIGANLVGAAQTSAKVTFVAGMIVSTFNVAILFAFRYKLPGLFSRDQDVNDLVSQIMPVCAVMQLFDGMAAVAHGLLRGVGKQEFGGYANLLVYYTIGLPISFGTAFGLGWRISGLWFGVTIGLFLVATGEYLYLYYLNWDKAVQEAQGRNENQ